MQLTLQTLLMDLVWFVAAGTVATAVFRRIAPYLWGRREGESIGQHIERTRREEKEKQDFQINLNMTPQRALRVRTINVAVLLGFMCFAAYVAPRFGPEFMTNSVFAFGVYVITGLFACFLAGVVPAGSFAGLTWSNRLEVRLYCAWLWPLNVIKAIRRKP